MAARISNGVFIGTCFASFVGTILCALYAKVPFVQAPGMGLNAFFAYTVVLAMGYTYSQSLVVVFVSGVLFIVITAIGLREAIIDSIPEAVINAVTPGVGLFITIIGLKTAVWWSAAAPLWWPWWISHNGARPVLTSVVFAARWWH